jgi:hypothetical protein
VSSQARITLPLGRAKAEQWAMQCLSKVVGEPNVVQDGIEASKLTWGLDVLLVNVAFAPAPFDSGTVAIVSAEPVDDKTDLWQEPRPGGDWGASKRLVRKLLAALAEPSSS